MQTIFLVKNDQKNSSAFNPFLSICQRAASQEFWQTLHSSLMQHFTASQSSLFFKDLGQILQFNLFLCSSESFRMVHGFFIVSTQRIASSPLLVNLWHFVHHCFIMIVWWFLKRYVSHRGAGLDFKIKILFSL